MVRTSGFHPGNRGSIPLGATMSILSRLFYYQPTLKLARQLLGKFLLRRTKEGLYVGKIVETEAYLGMKDLACHASKGKTERNKMMFGPPGQAYIYFIYGMHHCLNIVTGKKENPCAVLIRALEPIKLVSVETRHCLVSTKLLNGPAKLCREFKIDKKLNGWDLCLGKRLWLEDNTDAINRVSTDKIKIVQAKRIGVDYAGEWKNKPWRFYIKGNRFVSKK